jgi:hypothetical protein
MKKGIVGVIAGALLGLAGFASAVIMATGSYEGDGEWGVLTLSGEPRSTFRIFSQQPAGNYAFLMEGALPDAGTVQFWLPETGPGDAMPQFRVMVYTSGIPPQQLSIPGEHDWHWD